MLRAILLGALGLISVGSQPAQAGTRAHDAIAVFDRFCVGTGGKSDMAEIMISRSGLGNRLPEQLVAELQGDEGGKAWAIASPRDAKIMLGYSPTGICEVRLAEGDKQIVIEQFKQLATRIEKRGGETLNSYAGRHADRADIAMVTYDFLIEGWSVKISLSAADAPGGPQQHLMTFSFNPTFA